MTRDYFGTTVAITTTERPLVAIAHREERRRRCRCPRRRFHSMRQQRLGGHLRAFSNNLYSGEEEIVY